MAGAITRGKLIRADLANWDGKTATHSRIDATGGTVTGLTVGNEVDVLQVFGSGTDRTRATIRSATNHISTTACTLVFAPGTWTIDDNLTIASNFVCHLPEGCVFDIAAGKTLTFSGPVIADGVTHTSGSGTVVGFDNGGIRGSFYRRTATEIANGITPTNYAYPAGNVLRYGADSTGVTASDTAFANAVAAVCPVGPTTTNAGKVKIPAGKYLLQTRWNLTNSRVNGTQIRDSLVIEGDGMYLTYILGETGSGNAIIETTGSQFLTIRDLGLRSGSANKSTIGVLQALSTALPQTQNQLYERVSIILHDDATANSNVGTVGIWNFGAEENTYDSLYIAANVPLVWTSANDGTQPGAFALTSYQAPLESTHSLGMTAFTGETFMQNLKRRNATVIIQNIGSFMMASGYLAGDGTTTGDKRHIYFMGNAVCFDWKGVAESLETLSFNGGTINSKINIDWGGVDNATEPVIRVTRASASAIQASEIAIMLESSTSRAFLTTNDGDESGACSYTIDNTTIFGATASGTGTANLYVPVNVSNAGGVNVKLLGGANASGQTFAAGLTSDQANVTGAGTAYAITSLAWTEDYDDGASFNAATGVFTAKLKGRYLFKCQLSMSGLDASFTDMELVLTAGGQDYLLFRCNPGAIRTASTLVVGGEALVKLDAGQTANVKIKISGGAGDTVDLESGGAATNWRTRFEGRMLTT